mgnify:CR=1 FL=1|jgi:3-hydroxyisobutyrate dehydrogenase
MTSGRKIGFIGTGVMGSSMAGHLLNAGENLSIYNRTKAKAEDLLARGARWTQGPAEMAKTCDLIFTMLGYPEDVEEVIQNQLLPGMKPGTTIVDFTTSSPSLAKALAEVGEKSQVQVLDAPVSGGDLGARNATLSIMVGGKEDAAKEVWPYLEKLGKTLVHQGPAGSGQLTKMANQIAVAGSMLGMVESLAFAKKSGLNPDKVLDSIRVGAAGSWSLDNLSPRVLNGDDAPGFYIKHFIKDLGIALSSAESMELELPGTERALELYRLLQKRGHEDKGTQALFLLYT